MYFLSLRIVHGTFQKLYASIIVCFVAFWLGVFKKESFHLIDEWYYNHAEKYTRKEYNEQGLLDWEERVIARYFSKCEKLLVIGAGGGREVLALHKMGYKADGFECNERLVRYANSFLEEEGIVSKVKFHPRDEYPYSTETYDGIILGWGTYMLIRGKERRIELLKNMRGHVRVSSPILLSFYCRSDRERRFKITVKIANLIRGMLRRDFLDIGDYLHPNYVHYFTREEIASEMQVAGFQLDLYSTKSYGHAVGIAL